MQRCLSGGEYFGELVSARSVSGLTLTETRYPPHARLPHHSHERAYFCLVRRGSYREEYGGRHRAVGPLTLAFHPPGEVHAEEFGPREVWSFNVELAPDWPATGVGRSLPLDRPFDTRRDPAVGLAVRLHREFAQPDAASPLIIEGLALELLGHCARAALPGTAGGPPSWLVRVRDLLADRCTDPPSLAELADDAGVHPGHLAASFRKHFGSTAGEFARRQRLLFAVSNLTATECPLAEVALRAGFADQSHFTRTFRRHFGATPAAYRRAARGSKT